MHHPENSSSPVEPDAMGGKPDEQGQYPTYSPVTGLPDGTYELDANGDPVPMEESGRSGKSMWKKLRNIF